jgi:hypothetical protein
VLRSFIQTLALITTLESAIFLAKGTLGLSAEAIAALAGTHLDFNPHVIRSLAQQTADYRAGVLLLLLAFILQMANTLWPLRWDDFAISRKGAVFALGVGIVLMLVTWWLTDLHASSIERQVREVVQQSKPKAPPALR